ncbi:hypothetical protein HYALB_00001142 [Hymenoscyphus albidus]|uniref:Zn(2)-C6 fungal-type domain-containing protein n=1 Tax=Hymenoscyphus albidus TaxID=595503 RepID=A0A9N9LEU0_9HELO|nr:hypothetical protein HYALB_00001142 [Hymenoscyphus albidus]
MVNWGRRSLGCYLCRARRIKCDETKPACNQCVKTRRTCPGYRELSTIKSPGSRTSPDRQPNIIDRGRNTVSPPRVVSHVSTPISVDVEQQALCFFLTNFVLTSMGDKMKGKLDFVVPMLSSGNKTPLNTAFTALTFAALGNEPSGKCLIPGARRQYHRAMQEAKLALKDPTTATLDSTLATVVLFGYFEGVTADRFAPVIAHIDGAVTLLKLRGHKQPESQYFCQLFKEIRQQATVNAFVRAISIDKDVDWFMIDEPDHRREAAELNILTTTLQEDCERLLNLATRTKAALKQVTELSIRAEALEARFLKWSKSLPKSWQPRTVAWTDYIRDIDLEKSNMFPGKADLYEDIDIATTWNLSRGARLIVSSVWIRCTAFLHHPNDYRVSHEYAKAWRVGSEWIGDIIASVPYFCGWQYTEGFEGDYDDHLTKFAKLGYFTSPGKGINGMMLMWPLLMARCSDYASVRQRKWLAGRMDLIPKRMGFNNSIEFSEVDICLPSAMIMKDTAMIPGSVYTDCWRGPNARPSTDESVQESNFLNRSMDEEQLEEVRQKMVRVDS